MKMMRDDKFYLFILVPFYFPREHLMKLKKKFMSLKSYMSPCHVNGQILRGTKTSHQQVKR